LKSANNSKNISLKVCRSARIPESFANYPKVLQILADYADPLADHADPLVGFADPLANLANLKMC
jgi:hypothetical protein